MEAELAAKLALIGVLGVAAQWAAWRTHLPAIVLLTLTGVVAGPVLGLIDPPADFGQYLQPVIGIAVAFILFDGALSLNLREIRGVGPAVVRLIAVGIPITWMLCSVAAKYLIGLSWPVAVLFGAILVVTGPTVIIPALRQAHLSPRVGSVLKWEAIVNDPLGALLAVLVFDLIVATGTDHDFAGALATFGASTAFAAALGFAAGWLLAHAMRSDQMPEYFKAPILFAAVLGCFALANAVQDQGGLVTVTVFGATLANMRVASFGELRRFKEYIAVLMVGGVFILLTATLTLAQFKSITLPTTAFIGLVLLAIRPLAALAGTLGTNLNWRERTLIAWIAPRGVVAIAACGFFASVLGQHGSEDAAKLIPLSFAVVLSTVVVHGFSLRWLGKRLGLAAERRNGVIIVGASAWTISLAQMLAEEKVPVMIADPVWQHLKVARRVGLATYHGEVLSELAEFGLDLSETGYLVAASDNDAYNALVCVAFAHELGRDRVFQLGSEAADDSRAEEINPALRGRRLFGEHATFDEMMDRWRQGWRFVSLRVGEATAPSSLDRESLPILAIRGKNDIVFNRAGADFESKPDDLMIAFTPPAAESRRDNGKPGK